MAKGVITSEVQEEAPKLVVKVTCTGSSPYGADGQEIDFLESEIEQAILKGFINKPE
jgi:hypothetical protein